jgi:hypothetical protein
MRRKNLFHNGLTVELQDCLNMFPNMSYNELASATINKEGSLKACADAEEKKRKRIMPRSSESGGFGSAPLKYHMVYTPPTRQLR